MSKILVADDVPMMRDLLSAIMQSIGHDVLEAQNGIEVVDRLEDGDVFDLILIDIEMPGLDGISVVKKMKEFDPEGQTRICFVSGSRDKSVVMDALSHGGHDYIVKPVDKMILVNKVEKLIGGRKVKLATVAASLGATIVGAPFEIPLTIREVSEEHFIIESGIPLVKNTMIELSSEEFSTIVGSTESVPCQVTSVVKDGTNYNAHCEFVGIHESLRERIRSIVVKGLPLV